MSKVFISYRHVEPDQSIAAALEQRLRGGGHGVFRDVDIALGERWSDVNPFEGPRNRDYPNPPLQRSHGEKLFSDAVRELGYHPFPMPAAQMSRPYTNPDGASLGACVYCGYCMNTGCEISAKAVPQNTVLPAALQSGNFELRTRTWVTRINKSGNRATGVTYIDARGHADGADSHGGKPGPG